MKNTILAPFMLAIVTLSNAQVKHVPEIPGREEYIEVEKNVRLHVTDMGVGSPIVLIHGWPLSNEMYEYQYQQLAIQGFRVIGITMRGFGKSDKPFGTYNYDVFADDIKVVLDKLSIKAATLGGFSMGGAISLHYIARHNASHIRKLALFGAAAPLWTQRDDFEIGLTKAEADKLIMLSLSNRPQLYEDFGKIFAATESSITPGLANWLGGINMQASPYAVTQCLIALRDTDLRTDIKKVNIPVAIFHGVKDKICDFRLAEHMQYSFKNSYVVRFENSGHGLFIEELEKFNTELIKFAKP